ncbi:MAG: sensor histidine kinase [Ignavibacteriaceae bacterium]|nr:sensor histidine kinase [Ignavibacteriaceae bacterium]
MGNEIKQYLDIFKDWNNPVYYSLVLGFVLILLLLINYFRFFLPAKKRHILEKLELKLKNQELEIQKNQLEFNQLKILADLSVTDPNPIVRVNKSGTVIYKNNCANDILDNNSSLFDILPDFKFQLAELINNESNVQSKLKLRNRYYDYHLRGIKSLEVAQLTLFDLTDKMIYAKKLKQQKNKYMSLSFYLQDNLEKEKQRIGMELHDSICQELYLIRSKISSSMDDAQEYKQNFCEINSSIGNTISELREIMFNLRPKNIEEFGLYDAVQTLSENISVAKKITGKVEYFGEITKFDLDTEVYLFRIIQEALNNIIKHSEATEFEILFNYSGTFLMVIVSDNGHGFDSKVINNSQRYGLLNMSERVKALDGKMSINSSAKGTILRIKVPFK